MHGDHVRLPDRPEIGIVVGEATDGQVLVYVGQRRVRGQSGATAPIVDEYLECELTPTGSRSPLLAQWISARLDALAVYHGVRSWRWLKRAG